MTLWPKILEGTKQLLKRGRSVITHHGGPLLARPLVIMQNLRNFLLARAAAAGISHKHQYQVLIKVLFPILRQLQKFRGGQPCFCLSCVHLSAAIDGSRKVNREMISLPGSCASRRSIMLLYCCLAAACSACISYACSCCSCSSSCSSPCCPCSSSCSSPCCC